MRLIALCGLIIGAIVALGRLSATQLHAAGVALLTLILAHGLTVLPWLLTALFAWLWWKQKRRAWLYAHMIVVEQEERRRLSAEAWERDRAAERARAPKRKRSRPS